VHVLSLPKLVPVQVSPVIAKPGDAGGGKGAVIVRVILSADVALVPEFFSVNVREAGESPLCIVPKSNVPLVCGDHAIEGAFDVPLPICGCVEPPGRELGSGACAPLLHAMTPSRQRTNRAVAYERLRYVRMMGPLPLQTAAWSNAKKRITTGGCNNPVDQEI